MLQVTETLLKKDETASCTTEYCRSSLTYVEDSENTKKHNSTINTTVYSRKDTRYEYSVRLFNTHVIAL